MTTLVSTVSPASLPACVDTVPMDRSEELLAHVDPFIIEALSNPRHRLTVLRMELDVQRFMQTSNQHQFEFQHFPTSFLRCAAHRVAQYYGLQTISLDSMGDGTGSRIIVRKTSDSRYPPLRLSDISIKKSESEKTEQVKIAIRQRPNIASSVETNGQETTKSFPRTVEEREEEYEKARARIFSGYGSSDDGKCFYPSNDMREPLAIGTEENERVSVRDSVTKVAIFRDKEKDINDPDYDRNYDRYARGMTHSHTFSLGMCPMSTPVFQYEVAFSPLGRLHSTPTPLGYGPPNPNVSTVGGFGSTETPRAPVYVPWPSPAMLYAQSYEQFRHAGFQASFCQQPLSFEQSQNR